MYNIIDNVYLFTCIMGKLHNIATGVMITWAILGLGKEAFSQTTGNSNGKANVGQVQKNTSKQILWIDDYDYQKMLYMDISLLSPEVVKKVMLERINEIRIQNKLPTLNYDTRLDSLSYNFAKEKNGTERRNDPYCHTDKNGNWFYWRVKKAWLLPEITIKKINHQIHWVEENMVSTEWSIYFIINLLMDSQRHKENLLSPYINSVSFGYEKWWNVLVQDFVYFNNKKN